MKLAFRKMHLDDMKSRYKNNLDFFEIIKFHQNKKKYNDVLYNK